MKKIFTILLTMFCFGISTYAQQLTSDELKKLYEKNPNAVRVYQERVAELENIILKAEEKIEWYKDELKMNTGDSKAANSQIYKHIEQEETKIKEAKQNLESAHRYYRDLLYK